jgi:hypothetical protein
MASVELIPGDWDGSKPGRKVRKAVAEYPLSAFSLAFKARLSGSSDGLSVVIEEDETSIRGGDRWTIAVADLVDDWIGENEGGAQDVDGLEFLAAHLEEQAARLRAVMARHALGNRSMSISGRRVPQRSKAMPPAPARPEK